MGVYIYIINIKIPTLPETNVEPLKINGLEDEFPFEKKPPDRYSNKYLSLREGNMMILTMII